MKRTIAKLDPEVVKRQFPIEDRLTGWFFRVREVSAGAYVAEGTDLWGRLVSQEGTDPDQLVESCLAAARDVEHQRRASASGSTNGQPSSI